MSLHLTEALILCLKIRQGIYFEFQFHTPESLVIKEVNHKLYEKAR